MKKTVLLIAAFTLLFGMIGCQAPGLADRPVSGSLQNIDGSRAVLTPIPTDVADSYEDDDNSSVAKYITPDGAVREHNFFDDSNDWVKFMAYAGRTYRLRTQTYGDSDTMLYLYKSDVASGTPAIAENDDIGPQALLSQIEWKCEMSDIYYVKVASFMGKTGINRRYTLSVAELLTGSLTEKDPVLRAPGLYAISSVTSAESDSYEDDDDPSVATYINPDGVEMSYNFYDDSRDWIKFMAYSGKTYTIKTVVSGEADTVLYLYCSDVASGSKPIAGNDDVASGNYSSEVEWTCERSDIYYIKVVSYRYKTGENRGYTLSVLEK